MRLAPGTRLGPYDISARIGTGGMGEVYRATDTRLKRDVAVKVLAESLAGDPERLARFQREAEVLASLNHPNIAQIHGLEESDGHTALVMELVEGPSLADRIAQGPIPVDEALPIARQIAEALEAAHGQGIIHRDLKPANVKVRPDGTVKVLDFGLAKAMEPAGALSVGTSQSPTITTPPAMTQAGMILGTPAYMSPEQARGEPVDHRTDIWAIGCVLYETLAGRPAFEGATVADILSRVLRAEPDWPRLPASVSPPIRRLLRRCLEKSPKRRRQSAGDVRIDLEEAATEPAAVPAPPVRRSRGLHLVMASAVVAAVLLAIPAVEHLRESPLPEMRLQLVTPPTPDPRYFSLSPDGRSIVYVAIESSRDDVPRLYVRALQETEARPLAGTEGARHPFWSADSRSIGFFASERLFRVDAAGGPTEDLAPAPNPLGGTWSGDGTILFAPESTSPLLRVSDGGGTPRAATELDSPGQTNHRWPAFLPGGRRFLFYAAGEAAVSGLYLGSLDGGAVTRLGPADDGVAAVAGSDYVVFVQQGALVARRLDASRAAFVGGSLTLVPAAGATANRLSGLSASSTGILAYRETGPPTGALFSWFDREGKVLERGGDGNGPELSPDGRYVAFDRLIDGGRDVWRLDTVRGDLTRLTTHPAIDGYPVWSPDGQQLVFETQRNGTFDLYIRSSGGGGEERPLLESPDNLIPLDWSPNGFVLYRRDNDSFTASDLLALPTTGDDRAPRVVADTSSEERMGAFSPDGRWVAYDTNESGRFEVRVQAFPDPSGWVPVSTDGGVAPRWTTDGEIIFIAPDGTVMAVRVAATGTSFEAQKPVPLFQTRIADQTFNHQYAVSGDGRFLINDRQADAVPLPITLLLNWRP